jgi:hypothetical protein
VIPQEICLRNVDTRRVAEKLGLAAEPDSTDRRWSGPRRIYAASLQQR